jgi:hypothetical protein
MPRPLALALVLVAAGLAPAAEPLHQRIDKLIDGGAKSSPASPAVDDAGFLRRAWLDLAGTIPSVDEARKFLDDPATDKRAKLIDRLLAGPEYPRRMAELFHVVLLERLGDHPDWAKYLETSFAQNKPFDKLAREILRAAPKDEASRGASFFLAKRLENYGQNPVDYAGLTRDVGRLFLGKNFQCCQCHDHLTVKEYKQEHFQGLFAFVQSAYLVDAASATVGERPPLGKTAFQSVFAKVRKEIGPRLPGGKEIDVPKLTKAEQFIKPPDLKAKFPGEPRFSPLAELAREVPQSPDFARNAVNRLWWALMGRGLVHPLDLHHKDNPASYPEVLDLLAKEFVESKYDVKNLLRELALTKTYQRSSELPDGVTKLQPEKFLTALERRLSAEQMLWATLMATGERERVVSAPKPAAVKGKSVPSQLEQARAKFVRAHGGPVREPEDELGPSLKAALFVLNDPLIASWLMPRTGNLVDRLAKLPDDRVADELYLSVLTRRPDAEERQELARLLKDQQGKQRPAALGRAAWALLASTEFATNHGSRSTGVPPVAGEHRRDACATGPARHP